MASATRHLSRAALLYTRRISARRKTRWPVAQTRVSIPKVRSQFAPISATFTTSRFLRQQDEEDDEEEDEEDEEDEDEDSGKIRIGNPSLEGIKNFLDTLSPEERAEFEEESLLLEKEFMSPEFEAEMDADVDAIDKDIEKQTPNLTFPDVKPHPRYQGVWGDEEEDEFAQTEDGDDDYKDDEMTSIAHAQLELHREMREYARIAAWDMPLLSKLSKPFTPPLLSEPLRFRYTTYMGESHPAERKVVLEVCSRDLLSPPSGEGPLTESQRHTLLKLAGPRYNPSTDVIKLSCEKFETPAQNKRYLGDLVSTLISTAKDARDTFADVPLDTRHHKPRRRPEFPEAWRITPERRAQLDAVRQERKLLEQARVDQRLLVDGDVIVREALRKEPVYVRRTNSEAASRGEGRRRVAAREGGRR